MVSVPKPLLGSLKMNPQHHRDANGLDDSLALKVYRHPDQRYESGYNEGEKGEASLDDFAERKLASFH